MNARILVLVVIAVVMAGATFMVVKNHMKPHQVANATRVLVSTITINEGGFVRADQQLEWSDWPKEKILPTFITSDNNKISDYNGGLARHTIVPGEPITQDAILRNNDGSFMAAALHNGMRAVSMPVNATTGNAGFIFPGDRVDLILTHRVKGDMLASETFIQDIRVLAIDQMLDNPEKKAVVAKTVTLEVSPKQAEEINVAQSLGAISLSLRSLQNNSTNTVDVKSLTKNNGNFSTDNDVSKLMETKGEAHTQVKVYHGSSNEQLDFH